MKVKTLPRFKKQTGLKIRNEKLQPTTQIQRTERHYQEKIHMNKLVNLEAMDIFLRTCNLNLPKLNQEEVENLNRPIMHLIKLNQ